VELGATGQGDFKSAGRRNDVELVIGIIYSFEGTFTSATKATALPLKSILDKQEQIITTQVLALI
jgi:hypothetical protein